VFQCVYPKTHWASPSLPFVDTGVGCLRIKKGWGPGAAGNPHHNPPTHPWPPAALPSERIGAPFSGRPPGAFEAHHRPAIRAGPREAERRSTSGDGSGRDDVGYLESQRQRKKTCESPRKAVPEKPAKVDHACRMRVGTEKLRAFPVAGW
jgi:hypothetical protein